MKITWKPPKRRGNTEKEAYLGRWCVGRYYYDGLRSRESNEPPYVAKINLPGVRPILGYYDSTTAAKERVERAVAHWLECAKEDVE